MKYEYWNGNSYRETFTGSALHLTREYMAIDYETGTVYVGFPPRKLGDKACARFLFPIVNNARAVIETIKEDLELLAENATVKGGMVAYNAKGHELATRLARKLELMEDELIETNWQDCADDAWDESWCDIHGERTLMRVILEAKEWEESTGYTFNEHEVFEYLRPRLYQ